MAYESQLRCDACQNKRNLIKWTGWGGVAVVSLLSPPLGSFAAGVMASVENNLLGNPSEKKIHDLNDEIKRLNKKIESLTIKSMDDRDKTKYIKNITNNVIINIPQSNVFVGNNYYFTDFKNPLLEISKNPKHWGIIEEDKVNKSTRFKFSDYPLFVDIFYPDLEKGGLLHGGIPVDVITPMIIKSQIRKPLLYSYNRQNLLYSTDRLWQ
ncbi:MAG: hypothetical protein ACRCU2_19950 [Planktothrix sp.]